MADGLGVGAGDQSHGGKVPHTAQLCQCAVLTGGAAVGGGGGGAAFKPRLLGVEFCRRTASGETGLPAWFY